MCYGVAGGITYPDGVKGVVCVFLKKAGSGVGVVYYSGGDGARELEVGVPK